MKARKPSTKQRVRAKDRKREGTNRQQFREGFKWLLDNSIFEGLCFHGNTGWRPDDLVIQALLWSWSRESKLTAAFDDAVGKSRQIVNRVALSTYRGFARALETWTSRFMPRLQIRLHELMEDIGGRHLRIGRWMPLAIDGSRATTPRTESNERAFCAKNYGKGKTAKYRKKKTKGMRRRKNEKAKAQPQGPQMWITLMWQMSLGVPWSWKLGPSNSSERAHAKEMIEDGDFPENTLFVGDAGFVGYEFWKWILDHGHDFLVRVGGNVHLLKSLGFHTEKCGNIVYCWPSAAMAKKLPPLVLRLVKCKIGKTKVYLLTSVLDEGQLSVKEIVQLYKKRWGIELEYRALKQTFERRNLRSRIGPRAFAEMDWSIFALAVLKMFTLKEQMVSRKADPKKLSFAQSLRAVRQSLDQLNGRPQNEGGLKGLLKAALLDTYERKALKAGRYKPSRKDTPKCGAPVVVRAGPKHREKMKTLGLQIAA
jgi:IS4 transposase